MMRQILILAAALMLSACNAVVSVKPLFGNSGPPLKPGLWAMLKDASCTFDPAKPPADWPECASPAIFDGRTMRGPDGDKLPMRYAFARGEPRILQLELKDEDEPAPGEPRALYFYLAVQPEAGRGPVTSAEAWLVQCGPPPATGATGDADSNNSSALTDKPLPGLEITDKTCFADRASEVRNAARESRAWEDKPMRLRWIGPPPPKP